jgi:hypothetical protein
MKFFAIITILICFSISAKADTIDYWHVYYNNNKLKELTYYTENIIVIKSSDIKAIDSIRVFFYRDTPCDDCETSLIVNDNKDGWVTRTTGRGIGNMLRFSLADLLSYKRRTGKSEFQVCYFDKLNILQAEKLILFIIKLE